MSKIGHNNPPKDRKENYKSISVNKILYEQLKELAINLRQKKNVDRIPEGKPPIKTVSIPYVIDVLVTQTIMNNNAYEIQDNGRNIYEQMEKRMLRSYYSKRGYNAI